MKRMIIDIDEQYSDVISITVCGCKHYGFNVATNCFDTSKGNHISFTVMDGKIETTQSQIDAKESRLTTNLGELEKCNECSVKTGKFTFREGDDENG